LAAGGGVGFGFGCCASTKPATAKVQASKTSRVKEKGKQDFIRIEWVILLCLSLETCALMPRRRAAVAPLPRSRTRVTSTDYKSIHFETNQARLQNHKCAIRPCSFNFSAVVQCGQYPGFFWRHDEPDAKCSQPCPAENTLTHLKTATRPR
jgi:hypothetical protein